MARTWLLFPIFIAKFYISSTLPLPPYIVPCHRNDPKIEQCFLEHANDAISHLIPGDRYYNFPPLNPLKVVEASTVTENLRLNLSDVSVHGFETTRVINTTIDFATLVSGEVITMQALTFVGNYEIEGRILRSPIWGGGTANLTFVRPVFNFTWHMGILEKEEVQYVKVLDVTVQYDLERAVYNIEELYDGDKELGKRMNDKLNVNWRALHEEFSPVLSALIIKVARRLGENILAIVPLKDIFI